jgi:protocatechuate 3,4-dioxygenase beta subunit
LFDLSADQSLLTLDAGLLPITGSTIGDRVWEDGDGDGIQGAWEAGIPDVTVKLVSGSSVVATAVTETDGSYLFAGVAPGSYRIEFVPPPGRVFTVRDTGGDDVADSDASPASGLTAVFDVAVGESVLTIDAGMLSRDGVVIGRVWEDDCPDRVSCTTGNGVWEFRERRLEGVIVRLLQGSTVVAVDLTGENWGHYGFGDLSPGRYRVEVVPPRGRAFTLRDAGSDDTIDSDVSPQSGRTAAFTLAADEVLEDVDAGLLPGGVAGVNGIIGGWVWEDTNGNGYAYYSDPTAPPDTGEVGMGGVTVRLKAGSSVAATTTTAVTGFYYFGGLDPGSYRVEFVAPEGREFTRRNAIANDCCDSDASPRTGLTAPLDLDSDEIRRDVSAGLLP